MSLIEPLFAAIKHGDDEHQAWLREAIEAFFSGQPAPPVRGRGNKEAKLEAMQAEVERLRAALSAIRDGDVPRPLGRSWFPDKRESKHDKCVHDEWMYADCANCVAEFVHTTLSAASLGNSKEE